jgi:hypothetical protein
MGACTTARGFSRAFLLLVSLYATLTFSFVDAGARADELPDAATIRERSAAAVGAEPKNYVDVIDEPGGTYTTYQRGDDVRIVDDLGDVKSQSGTYKGDRWHQDDNGHTVVDEPDPGLATPEKTVTRVSRVTTPVDAYAVSTLNSKGLGTIDYYDPLTWYIVRREHVYERGRTVTTYADFAAFGPRHLAKHWTTTTVDGDTASYTRRSYTVDAATEDDVTMPSSARTLVVYPFGVNSVSLPVRFTERDIIVRVMIGGKGYDMLLDSGAADIAIDPIVAAQNGLHVTPLGKSSVNAGVYSEGSAVVPAMSLGALTMSNVAVHVLPVSFEDDDEKAGVSTKVVGLIGFDFLCESGITIDYVHHTVTAQRDGTYSPPTGKDTIALPLRLGSQQPMISVSINGVVAERTLVDTGAEAELMVFDYFARRHPEAIVDHGVFRGGSPAIFSGVGGNFMANPHTVNSMRLGYLNFHDFTIYQVVSRGVYENDQDALFGSTLLAFFDVHFDYPNGMMYLVPNKNFKAAKS